MIRAQEETEAREASPSSHEAAFPEVHEATTHTPQIQTEAPAAVAGAVGGAAGGGEEEALQSQAAGAVQEGPIEVIRPLPLSYGGERGGRNGGAPKQRTHSLSLYVGQQVRIHLVDLLRSRLLAIPSSSFACMDAFFKQMYTEEVETDTQLAQLYAQHCSSKSNPSFRPFRRIRGTLTALYSSKQEGNHLDECEISTCGVELCFPVTVGLPLTGPRGGPTSMGAPFVGGHSPHAPAPRETKTFILFRRWPLREFLELRRHYKLHHHVDLFLGRSRGHPGEKESEAGMVAPSAVKRFTSLYPHLLAGQGVATVSASDPFILNGSVVAYLETPQKTPTAAAATAAETATPAETTAAASGSPAGEGGEGEASAAAAKKRGRPRKYPRLEYTGAPVEGPSQVQLRPVGASPGGPYGIAVKQLGVHTSISDYLHTDEAEAQSHEEGGGGLDPPGEGVGPPEAARAPRARRARRSSINWKQRLKEASLVALKAERPRGPRVMRVVNRTKTTHARTHKCVATKDDVSHNKEDISSIPSGTASPAAPAAAAAAAASEGRQEPASPLRCLDQQQDQQQQQQQVQVQHEDVLLLSPQSVYTSPSSGVLASPRIPSPTPEKGAPPARGPPPSLQDLLRPYYRRCIELLLGDLLHCLRSLSYKKGELEERVMAVKKCLALASSPLVGLPCLEALITHFGTCVKNRSSLSELDRQTQQGLVEDVLYLSRFLTGDTAAPATSAGERCTSGPPSPRKP
ncbi:hypothetical protein ACSSS7_001674 [Eimeria intestinalis]